MTKDETLKQALNVLKGCLEHPDAQDAIYSIEAALAQPEPADFDYFKEWMCREIPPMTVIGQPEWWAKRIYDRFIQTPTPQRKQLTEEHKRFCAQHQFLDWNRAQEKPPVAISYEYAVFSKAIDFYIEAAHGIKGDA